ncbi:MAG: hypothetical protein JSR59_20370 [Proteobacteria bacterium]|nr:hypothetical protein [Pseudomonadota bacterium]
MKHPFPYRPLLLAAFAWTAAAPAMAAGYITLPSTFGGDVLTACNPTNDPAGTDCLVTSLPGESGYAIVASRSAPVIINDVTIGTLSEKVWRLASDPTQFIFGVQVQVNAEVWDSSGLSFNVNDIFRRTLPKQAVAIAYYWGDATKALLQSGRTSKGLNEYTNPQPRLAPTWADFRVDVNAADPDGMSSPNSPWLLVKTRAPLGAALNSFGIRLLNSDVEDVTQAVDLYTSGYQPRGVPSGDGGGN